MQLGDVVTLNYGWSLPEKKRLPGDIPVYGSNGIVGWHSTALVDTPGIVVGRKGSAGRVHFAPGPFCPIDTTFYAEPGSTSLDIRFTAYMLRHADLTRLVGDVGVPGLNREMAYRERVRFPRDLAEQRAIATLLAQIESAGCQQERLLALTGELKSALLAKLFTEGTRGGPEQDSGLGTMPAHWRVGALGEFAKVGNGSTPKRDNAEFWNDGTIPWLTSGKIHERFIAHADEFVTPTAVRACHLPRVQPDSVLIAITGQGKTLGTSAIVSFETCVSQHLAYVQFHSHDVLPEFVLWYLQTRYEHLRSVALGGGSTKGALTCGYLKTYPIPIAPLDEQREIVAVFDVLHRKQQHHEGKRAALSDLFRTLLHQLMTAQLRVHDLDLAALDVAVAA